MSVQEAGDKLSRRRGLQEWDLAVRVSLSSVLRDARDCKGRAFVHVLSMPQ